MSPSLSYDVSHLLGALVLLCSFGLLSQHRLLALIRMFLGQGVVLASLAAWEGYSHQAHHLFVSAAVILILKAGLVPFALRYIIRRLGIHHREVDPGLGAGATLVLGVSLVVLSIVVVLPATEPASVITRESLSNALSVVLIGVLMMITRRNAISQLIGFMSIENGLLMAAIGVSGIPFVVEMSIAFSVMVAFFIFGIFIFGISERLETLNIHELDVYRGERH